MEPYSVEKLHARLREPLAAQRRESKRRTWTTLSGIVAVLCLLPASALLDGMRWPPPTAQHWLALIWFGAAVCGALGLLVFGLTKVRSRRTDAFGLVGLWVGNLAAAGAVAVFFPFAIALVALPVIMGAQLVARYSRAGMGWLYLSTPFLSLCCRIAYEQLSLTIR